MKFTKRYSHGLDVTSSFTWQKELNLGNSPVNDVFNRANQKALSQSSQPFISVTAFTYRTPKAGANRLVQNLVGGWTVGGIMRYASGALIGVAGSRTNLNTYTFNTNTRFNRVAGQPLFLSDPNCGCIDPNKNQQILNPAAWADTPVGTWGNSAAYYNDYRWRRQISESMSLGRRFQIRERLSFSVRAEFFNVFNRLMLPTPTNDNPTATPLFNPAGAPTAGFGYITNSNNVSGQRNGQLVGRFEF